MIPVKLTEATERVRGVRVEKMIFLLQYALIVGGYAATAFLLGNYMKEYTGARDIDLGFIFMIQPAVIIVRPFVCSLADRYQSHRSLYLYCSMISVLTHIPFILVPFCKQYHLLDDQMFNEQVRFWLLVVCHFIGCICFCCMRTLGDVLTVNYCKQIGSSYTEYRKWGPISFGVCSLILGYINTTSPSASWSLGIPDYVPGFILYTGCHLILTILFYSWPPEFFIIYSDAQLKKLREASQNNLPARRETGHRVAFKLARLVTCSCLKWSAKTRSVSITLVKDKPIDLGEQEPARSYVDSKQQMRILFVLIRQDFRVPIFLLILVFCGVVGHSIQNFVYVYLHTLCRDQQCNSSTISGYIMAGICVTETIAYMLSSRLTRVHNKLLKIQLALVTLAIHYSVLAFLVQSSPYYFLVESLHGFEFGLMVATSIESGDYFANEVDLVIPELMQAKIISPRDDLDLIRVSLVATMIACFLLVYDGLGGVIGSLMYGFVINNFGYPAAFKLNTSLTLLLLAATVCGTLAARCLSIKPRILLARDQRQVSCEIR